jgi:hypothetical protein
MAEQASRRWRGWCVPPDIDWYEVTPISCAGGCWRASFHQPNLWPNRQYWLLLRIWFIVIQLKLSYSSIPTFLQSNSVASGSSYLKQCCSNIINCSKLKLCSLM